MTEASARTRTEVRGGGPDRYSTFLSLSGDAIGRFEMDRPLDPAVPVEGLDYGKPSMLRPSPTSLAEVWRRASRACAALARERRVTVTERLAADVPSLDLDSTQVERAFENLLTNAIQHAPAGSVVLILAVLLPVRRAPEGSARA